MPRLDPKLLSPLRHRGEASQAHLALVRSRDALIRCRTQLVDRVRGSVKAFGARLPKCSASSFHNNAAGRLPEGLAPALEPILETIADLTARIRAYDRELEALAEELYPETRLLRQVPGVGTLTALAFVLTIEDPVRFGDSRTVGAYTSVSSPAGTSRGIATLNGASPSGATDCSGGSWSGAPTTWSGPLGRIPTYGATAKSSRPEAVRVPRSGPW